MPTQTDSGKAFEFALASSLHDGIAQHMGVLTVRDRPYLSARGCFEMFEEGERLDYRSAADAAVERILDLEPRLRDPSGNHAITLSIQEDRQGRVGDVRDIVSARGDGWEIGFSAKNNHDAAKHSRLSNRIDFGREWFGIRCSEEYMGAVRSIFAPLLRLQEQNPRMRWSELPDKNSGYYGPVLDAFEAEMRRIGSENACMPGLLVEYLLGKRDFYKIKRENHCTVIQGYNLHGDLNCNSDGVRPRARVRRLRLPTQITCMSRNGSNRLTIIFDRGWEISFRIHNARTIIEPSLKFDITLVGIPNDMYNDRVMW